MLIFCILMGKLILVEGMLNNNLKFCRETLEMTQKELGFVFGVSDRTISGWENCYDIIPLSKLVKFCNLYHYSVDYVVGLTRNNQNYKNKKLVLDKKIIGRKLKKLRKDLGLTQQQMADECSISQTAYSNYELGINLISSMTLYTICKNHKVSMDNILIK